MHINLVAPSDAGVVWTVAKPFLELSVPYSGGRYTIDDMYEQVRQGIQQLWIVADDRQPIAAFTTRVTPYPSATALSCQFCGGSRMDEWIQDVDDLLERVRVDAKCDFIEMTGRPGWIRKLPSSWHQEFSVYRRQAPIHDQLQPSGNSSESG